MTQWKGKGEGLRGYRGGVHPWSLCGRLCSGPRDGWVQEPLQMSCYSQGENFVGQREFRAKEQGAGQEGVGVCG